MKRSLPGERISSYSKYYITNGVGVTTNMKVVPSWGDLSNALGAV